MFSVHCFIVAAALAAVVAILQLPTLLLGHLEDFAYLVSSATCGPMLVVYCVARNVGIFAEFVDNLLRDEELRSALEPEYAKLRAEYRKQVAAIGALNDKALEVCKDHNRRCTELPPRYAFRRRPYVKPAGYRDTEWREPHTLAKMFYATDLKVVFLCAKVKQLRSAVLANKDLIRQAEKMVETEHWELLNLIDRIDEYKQELVRDEAEARKPLRVFRRLTNPYLADANDPDPPVRPQLPPWPWFCPPRPRKPWNFQPRPRRELPELPLHAAARASRRPLPAYQPAAAVVAPPLELLQFGRQQEEALVQVTAPSLPLAGPLEVLQFGCPQEVPVLVSAPAPEQIPSEQEVLALAVPDLVDTDMPDAPDAVEEVVDVSMVDAEPLDLPDVDIMAHAPEQLLLPPQRSPAAMLPAPTPRPALVSTVPADTPEVEEQKRPFPSMDDLAAACALAALAEAPTVSAAQEDTAKEAVEQVRIAEEPTPNVPSLPLVPSLPSPALPVPTPPAVAAAPTIEEIDTSMPVAESGSRPSSTLVPQTVPRPADADVVGSAPSTTEAEAGAQKEQRAPAPEPEVLQTPPPEQHQQQRHKRKEKKAEKKKEKVSVPQPAPAPVPAPFTFGATASTSKTQSQESSAPAPETTTFSFEFQPRQIAKPKSRKIAKPRRAQAPAAAASASNAAPAPAVAGPSSSSSSAHQPAPAAAPQSVVMPPSPPAASSKGKGKGKEVACPPPPPPPAPAPAPAAGEWSDVVFPGDYLRTLCEEWVGGCVAFMSGSRLCGRLSPSWVVNWQRAALAKLAQDLGPDADDREYAHDEAAAFVKRFFVYNLRRRMDGPDTDGKNAVLRHLKEMAARKDLDLGVVEISG